MKLLVANRGEIAIRIARAASELDIPTLAIYSEDDANSLHIRKTSESAPLSGQGIGAYLDIDQIVGLARQHNCTAIHPGYGFLSENSAFAQRCIDEKLQFVGPQPESLLLLGNKVQARQLAEQQGIPVIKGLSEAVTLEQAQDFYQSLPAGSAMVLKAVSGGGGRGMRVVSDTLDLEEAYRQAQSEASTAFGSSDVYVEQYIRQARHIEVQVAGDHSGQISHFGDRDCSIQRRHQKLIEIAPAPVLDVKLRQALADASVNIATAVGYQSLGTIEFLVETGAENRFYFIEANARLQVEHTVTEAVTGIDLVHLQLQLAQGMSLQELGLTQADIPEPRGYAIQTRVNMETMTEDGATLPSGGTLTAFDVPSGPGLRTDTFGYTGYQTNPGFDSLLAKVVGYSPSPDFKLAVKRTNAALSGFRIEGLKTNIPILQSILMHPDFLASRTHTQFIDAQVIELVAAATSHVKQYFSAIQTPASNTGQAGARIDSKDPLAVLTHGKTGTSADSAVPEPVAMADSVPVPEGTVALFAPMQGTIVNIYVDAGEDVIPGRLVLVMEAMKMEHEICAQVSGTIRELTVAVGDTVYDGHALAFIEEKDLHIAADEGADTVDLDHIRGDLAEVIERHEITLDARRPDAVAKRRNTNQRTARENIDDLCDPGTFLENGQLVLTPGTGLPREEVIKKFSTDGMVTGIGTVNGEHFDRETARCVVMSYDYTVLAGTQGAVNHPKTDRMLDLAAKWKRPVIFFTEGGGGRAGTGGKREGGQSTTKAGQGRDDGAYRPLDTPTFATMGRLSGLVPMVGITSRFCFAGNASLLGCCDVIIATRDANIGMGGPALIEGGNLGVFRPEEIGPLDVQTVSGVVDVAVEDEAEAVAVAKQYVSYFQGNLKDWDCPDQRLLRNIVPENRLRIYNVRDVINTVADTGSVLELRPLFGLGMVTAFIRIEGQAIGVIANNPIYLSGAIDSDGSDKAARFMQLCDAFDIPILVLCDTPGMMVGPEVERTGLVRHCSRLFVTGANLTVPHVTMVLRKAYGLGAQAMAGGSFKEPFCTLAWPTGEFGGMGLEGQVKLGFRNELAAIEDPEERVKRYDDLVEDAYLRGRALNSGVSFAVDDVIDPADSRLWISNAFNSVPKVLPREGKKRRNIDTW
jgi:acetyl/propionyl-CoA carboxylase alpha subunit/acetyl-CoA carboxylase carboxyltransferase component